MTENAEIIQTEQVAPAPVTPETPASVKATDTVAVPVESPAEVAEKKITAAFIRERQEKRELKRQLAEAKANIVPPPVVPTEVTEQAAAISKEASTVPAPKAEYDIAELEKNAIKELSEDKDLAKVPGSIMDVLDMIESDKRLSKLYNEIDPALAIREAKNLYLSKSGISAPPPMPKSAPTSGGIGSGSIDLEALINECNLHKPGTKQYAELANKITVEMRRQGIS